MSLDDPRWPALQGGYKLPYDASVPLRRMEEGEEVWEELWEELYHQGDVGPASYAAVPHLVRLSRRKRNWNLYSLVGWIEVERHRKTNPPVPDWLLKSYQEAWEILLELAHDDLRQIREPFQVQSALGVLAIGAGQIKTGALLLHLDSEEIKELSEERLGWTELYELKQ